MEIHQSARQGCIAENHQGACLQLLSEEERRSFEERTVEVTYRKGDVMVKQGALASHVLFLQEGLVKIYLEGQPKDLILNILPPGSFLGLTSLFEGNHTFLHSAATYEDSLVRMTDLETMKALIAANPRFASAVIGMLNEATAQLYGRFYCLSRKQSHGRVADVLLCLSERVYGADSFRLGLTRGDLADLTGLTPESVIRILKEFKDEGIIDSRAKDLVIKEKDRLVRISQLA